MKTHMSTVASKFIYTTTEGLYKNFSLLCSAVTSALQVVSPLGAASCEPPWCSSRDPKPSLSFFIPETLPEEEQQCS